MESGERVRERKKDHGEWVVEKKTGLDNNAVNGHGGIE